MLLDGGFGASSAKNGIWQEEDERRLYYVGMTRAAQTLTLLQRQDADNPFVSRLDGEFLCQQENPARENLPDEVLDQRFEVLSLADLFLNFAGQKRTDDQVHATLCGLHVGDDLRIEPSGDHIMLVEPASGQPVARLSQLGQDTWRPRLASIRSVRILSLCVWRRVDSDAQYRDRCQCDQWELPIVEIAW